MKLEVKFRCDEVIYFMRNNKVQEWEIRKIKIEVHRNVYLQDKISINYTVVSKWSSDIFKENEIFWTKQDLLNNL